MSRQESINIFSGGLSTDLHPLTTPNNLLIDAHNATYITFNDNEQILQNDMGNVAIQYESNDINLGEGFVPFGVKEYGGVLYIVSGRAGNTITANGVKIELPNEYDSEITYSTGEYVAYLYEDITYYFKSKVNNNLNHTPTDFTNTGGDSYWQYFTDSSLETFEIVHEVIEAQVGSYPSPDQPNADPITESLNFTDTSLNTLKSFGDIKVSAGDKLNFTISNITPTEYSYLSRWEGDTFVHKIYKLAIYQQTSNTLIDLTDTFTHTYSPDSNTLTYWFDPTGSQTQYVNNRYKGKLVGRLELEEIDSFKLLYVNTTPTDGKYSIEFKLDTSTNSDIICTGYNLYKDGGTTPEVIGSFPDGIVTLSNIDPGTTVNYVITPIFNYDLPTEYYTKYTISGSIIAQQIETTIQFAQYENYYTCLTELGAYTGVKELDVFVITDNESPVNYLDINGQITTTPTGFVRQGVTNPFESDPLAEYIIGEDDKPTLTTNISNTAMQAKFEEILARYESTDCELVNFSFRDYYTVPLSGGVITGASFKSGDTLVGDNTYNLTNTTIGVAKDTYTLNLSEPSTIYPYSDDAVTYCNSIVVNTDFDKIILANSNIIITVEYDEGTDTYTMFALRYLYDSVEIPSFSMNYTIQKSGGSTYTGTTTFNYQATPFASHLAQLHDNLTTGTYDITLTLNEPTYQSPEDYFTGTSYFSKLITNDTQSISPSGSVFKNTYTFTEYEV